MNTQIVRFRTGNGVGRDTQSQKPVIYWLDMYEYACTERNLFGFN